jgi:hypothetical protein
MLIEQYLGREILGSATERLRELVRTQVSFGETKVAERDMACGIK